MGVNIFNFLNAILLFLLQYQRRVDRHNLRKFDEQQAVRPQSSLYRTRSTQSISVPYRIATLVSILTFFRVVGDG